jgi:hypothetical protein
MAEAAPRKSRRESTVRIAWEDKPLFHDFDKNLDHAQAI